MPLFYLNAMEKISGELTVKVETPEEYREALRNAESFGMELDDTEVRGEWRRLSDDTVHNITNSYVSLGYVTESHFHINAGEVFKCEPSNEVGEAGHVRLTFR